MARDKRTMSVYLEFDQFDFLFSIHKRTGVPMAYMIREAVEEYIKKKKNKGAAIVGDEGDTGKTQG